MKQSNLAWLLLLLLATLLVTSCEKKAEEVSKPAAPPKINSNKQWRDEAIWVVNHGDAKKPLYKASPAVKIVTPDQDVTFSTDGCSLTVNPNPDLFSNIGAPGTTVEVHISKAAKRGAYRYDATCNGSPVEGNSPPVIIVDP